MTIAATVEVRKATEGESPRLGQVLASAFQDNPDICWCVPDPHERRRLLPSMFGFLLRTYLPLGEVYTTDGLDAAAVWVPPAAQVDEGAFVAELTEIVPAACQPRMFHMLELFGEQHPDNDHFYLPAIGTEAARQSRGIGSALLRPVLDRCDSERIPAYLESTSRRNRALYLRHGFEVIGEIRLPDGPSIWPMWREAR
ncbi:MAG: GNAT family N-acetyltransferase [Nitriliruptor sp.]|nr:MAG: GNAT family N-acetyltransferase [Nitriliruptor sp.]